MKSGGQGTWWRLGWGGSRGNDIYLYGLEFFNVRSNKIKQKQRKKRERRETKPKEQELASRSVRQNGPVTPRRPLCQHSPCAHPFSGEIQLLLQQPWCRRTRMDDRSDYAAMHNNWIAAGYTSRVNMQSWFDWIQWKEHLNPGRQHFFFFCLIRQHDTQDPV